MLSPDDSSLPQLNLGLLLQLAYQFKEQVLSQHFAAGDITSTQFKVLISIYNGFTRPADIGRNIAMDTGAMSRMVARLLKHELVVRNRDPQDKRQIVLGLTDKGRQVCSQFQDEPLSSILEVLTARLTAEESRQLSALLSKLLPEHIIASYR